AKLENQLRKSDGDRPKDSHLVANNVRKLLEMVTYCEDNATCRRRLMLGYLGEEFDEANCHETCDNCQSIRKGAVVAVEEDVTPIALALLTIVKQITLPSSSSTNNGASSSSSSSNANSVSPVNLCDIYRGAMTKAIKTRGWERLDNHGAGKQFPIAFVQRVL